MLKDFKIKLMKEILIKGDDFLSLKDFNERDGRLFFIDEFFKNPNEEICSGFHTAMELIVNNNSSINNLKTVYEVKPVFIYTDEEDKIIKIISLKNVVKDKAEYFLYWKDLFKSFIQEVSEYVEYVEDSLINLIKELIEKYPNGTTYYYADGNNNKFSYEILDLYEFVGTLCCGISNESIVISNLKLVDKYSKKDIIELPWVGFDGILDVNEENEEDIEYFYATLLHSMSNEEMKQYIFQSILKLGFIKE